MKYSHIIQTLYGNPWAILQAGWYSAHQVFIRHFDGTLSADGLKLGISGDAIPEMSIDDGIAVIPIHGTLIKGAGMIEKSCGVVSHEDIQDNLDAAEAAGVRGILLDIDSPGGTVLGTPELAHRVSEIAKEREVIALTDGLMASAAYYIAAGASKIVSTLSANVGSIGVIWETHNVADALKAQGIEVNIFTSGRLKGMGHPARKLSDEQSDFMQSRVNELGAEFRGFVTSHRDVSAGVMEGQAVSGIKAIESGLVDDIYIRKPAPQSLFRRTH